MSERANKSHTIFERAKYPSAALSRDFGSQVLRLRKMLGWTQSRLAHEAGLRRETVARLEAGSRRPAAETVFALERAFGVDRLVVEWPESGSFGAGSHGPRCRERRRAIGLTLSKAARMAGVSSATLSRFEREDGVATSILRASIVDDEVHAAIHNAGLATALGFASLGDLNRFCLNADESSVVRA